jgi:hypothetical protein
MKKTALIKGRNSFYFFAILLITSALFFTACNDEKSDGPDGSKGVQLNCIMLSKAQVQAWVDSGWTKPGSAGEIKEIVFQFFTSKATDLNRNMQLICYPGENYGNVKAGGKTTLAIDTACKNKSYTGDVIFGNNILKLESLGIINKDGTLKEFDFIRFSPEQAYPPYINFKVEIVTKGQTESGGGGTLPCPVWCG